MHISYMYMIFFLGTFGTYQKAVYATVASFRSPEEWPNEDGRFRPPPPTRYTKSPPLPIGIFMEASFYKGMKLPIHGNCTHKTENIKKNVKLSFGDVNEDKRQMVKFHYIHRNVVYNLTTVQLDNNFLGSLMEASPRAPL